MKYYAGLDVSMKITSICIVNQEKKIVFNKEVATDPDVICSTIRSTKLDVENCAIESGAISHWLVNEISSRGLSIICIDARKMSKILSININKTDKNDAYLIAEALRCGFYSEVYQKPQEHVEFKILIASRRTLKETATKLKNAIRGHLKAFGIRLGVVSNQKFDSQVLLAINEKTEVVRSGIKALLKVFIDVNEQIMKLEKQLKKLAHADKDVQLLSTIPGVGFLTAYTFKVHLGDPIRFKTSRTVGAYFGMTPRQYSSGETQKQGRISKCGSSEVRFLLNESACVLLYRTNSWSKLKVWGTKIKKKKGHKKATMAVGRKLCVIMHRMLITKKPFEYGASKEKDKNVQQVG